jgi:8-oxo-dGTP pyrophosphatase MutT (NUDIX family)
LTADHAPGAIHPALAAVLAESAAVAEHETSWMNGAMPLRITAYTETEQTPRLPLEIISSIRCIVRVAGKYVFCENKTSRHPWPGGRRNPGESFADTASREVHEETGWLLKPETMRQLGWLHLRHLGPEPDGNEGPYPDFLQLVFVAEADRRDGDLPEDAEWTDPDGYELESRLVLLDEAIEHTSTDMHAQVFLALLREERDRCEAA